MIYPFHDSDVEAAWISAGGICQCNRPGHGHAGRCMTILNRGSRGRDTPMGWEARRVDGDTSPSCGSYEILCHRCYREVNRRKS